MIETIYILTIFLLGVLLGEKKKKLFLILSSIILILISGLRNIYWGPDDTYNYSRYYEMVSTMSYNEIFLYFWKDPLYHVFAKSVSYLLTDSYTVYFLFLAFLFVGGISFFIYKYSRNALLSIIIFIGIGIFGFSMIGVRQSLAQVVIILSYVFIQKSNFKRFCLCILLAACFHKSALIFFIAYPICHLRINRIIILGYISVSSILLISGGLVLQRFGYLLSFDERFSNYLGSEITLSYAGLIQLLLFLVIVALFYKKAIKADDSFRILLHLLLLAIVFQTMAVQIAEFFRVAWYFKMFLIILIPNILEYSDKKKLYSWSIIFALLFYSLVWNASKHDYAFFWQNYTPNFIPW